MRAIAAFPYRLQDSTAVGDYRQSLRFVTRGRSRARPRIRPRGPGGELDARGKDSDGPDGVQAAPLGHRRPAFPASLINYLDRAGNFFRTAAISSRDFHLTPRRRPAAVFLFSGRLIGGAPTSNCAGSTPGPYTLGSRRKTLAKPRGPHWVPYSRRRRKHLPSRWNKLSACCSAKSAGRRRTV